MAWITREVSESWPHGASANVLGILVRLWCVFKTFVCHFIVSREAGNLFFIIHTKLSNCDAQFDHLKHASCRLIRGEVRPHSSSEAREFQAWIDFLTWCFDDSLVLKDVDRIRWVINNVNTRGHIHGHLMTYIYTLSCLTARKQSQRSWANIRGLKMHDVTRSWAPSKVQYESEC